jgi:hypothetical protein
VESGEVVRGCRCGCGDVMQPWSASPRCGPATGSFGLVEGYWFRCSLVIFRGESRYVHPTVGSVGSQSSQWSDSTSICCLLDLVHCRRASFSDLNSVSTDR